MVVELGARRHEVDFDEANSRMIVDGTAIKVEASYTYTYKCYKRPRKIAATDGVQGLKKFFEDDFWRCAHLAICDFVLGKL